LSHELSLYFSIFAITSLIYSFLPLSLPFSFFQAFRRASAIEAFQDSIWVDICFFIFLFRFIFQPSSLLLFCFLLSWGFFLCYLRWYEISFHAFQFRNFICRLESWPFFASECLLSFRPFLPDIRLDVLMSVMLFRLPPPRLRFSIFRRQIISRLQMPGLQISSPPFSHWALMFLRDAAARLCFAPLRAAPLRLYAQAAAFILPAIFAFRDCFLTFFRRFAASLRHEPFHRFCRQPPYADRFQIYCRFDTPSLITDFLLHWLLTSSILAISRQRSCSHFILRFQLISSSHYRYFHYFLQASLLDEITYFLALLSLQIVWCLRRFQLHSCRFSPFHFFEPPEILRFTPAFQPRFLRRQRRLPPARLAKKHAAESRHHRYAAFWLRRDYLRLYWLYLIIAWLPRHFLHFWHFRFFLIASCSFLVFSSFQRLLLRQPLRYDISRFRRRRRSFTLHYL